MNCLLLRFIVWLITLVIFPLSGTVLAFSFKLEVLGRITVPALPPGAHVVTVEGVLDYLGRAEKKENNPWFQDDYRIAWMTAKWARDGVPAWAWHRFSSPHVAATYQVLRCHPDQVWPRIVAARKAKLGAEYSRFYDASDNPIHFSTPPKKASTSVRNLARKGVA
jgi:hypothetical protein